MSKYLVDIEKIKNPWGGYYYPNNEGKYEVVEEYKKLLKSQSLTITVEELRCITDACYIDDEHVARVIEKLKALGGE